MQGYTFGALSASLILHPSAPPPIAAYVVFILRGSLSRQKRAGVRVLKASDIHIAFSMY